jgi:hypothetical protein
VNKLFDASGITKYQETRNFIQSEVAKARELARVAFDAGAQQLLKDLDIESFSWTQYTPYFNDGDVCVFRVNYDYPKINGESAGDYYKQPEYEVKRELERNVADFLGIFDESDLNYLFGDHVEITVSAEGTTVEEYEHD